MIDGLYFATTLHISQRDATEKDKTMIISDYFLSLYLMTLYQLQSYVTLPSAMK